MLVTRSDGQVVRVGGAPGQQDRRPANRCRAYSHHDKEGATGLGDFYIRLPDANYNAYGDLLPECDSRGVVWGRQIGSPRGLRHRKCRIPIRDQS